MLNHQEKKLYPQRITKNELFINKYSWKGINFPSEKDIGKNVKKIIEQLL